MEIKGLEAVIDKECEILILGSIPSVVSREKGFYYANPTNRFWLILENIFNEKFIGLENSEKVKLLLKNHIALFDVYASCDMKKDNSSLDSNIKDIKFNDILKLTENTNIKRIYITSKKAYNDFVKHFKSQFEKRKIEIINLPSPSSANRSIYKSDADLIQAWKNLMK